MAETATIKRKFIKGSAKGRVFENGGQNIYLSLFGPDLDKLPRNEDQYVRIVVSEYKEPDRFGNTHSIYENEWKPEPGAKKKFTPPGGNPTKRATAVDLGGKTDDLPF